MASVVKRHSRACPKLRGSRCRCEPSWRVRWSAGGRGATFHSRTFVTSDEALQFEATLTQATVVDPRGGRRRFREIAETWRDLQPHKAESSRRRDESLLDLHILPVFGAKQIGHVRPSDIERWVSHLERAPDTVTKALRIVRSVFEIARKDGLIPANPAADVKPPKPRRTSLARALDDAEVEALIRASDEVDPATAPIVWVMARCGLRIGEALALQRHDLDLDTGMLRCRALPGAPRRRTSFEVQAAGGVADYPAPCRCRCTVA